MPLVWGLFLLAVAPSAVRGGGDGDAPSPASSGAMHTVYPQPRHVGPDAV